MVVNAEVREPTGGRFCNSTFRKGESMNRISFALLALGLSLAPVLCLAAEPNADKAKAIAEIEKLGGKVTIDEKSPGKPVIGVSFCDRKVTDAGLKCLKGLTSLHTLILRGTKVTDEGLSQLKGMTTLQSLNLGYTHVTDEGLAHLKGLINLQVLILGNTKLTNAGLGHLKGLSNLHTLLLGHTTVTDAGLENLKELSQLQSLYLGSTKVTDEGVKKLQKALPNCTIDR